MIEKALSDPRWLNGTWAVQFEVGEISKVFYGFLLAFRYYRKSLASKGLNLKAMYLMSIGGYGVFYFDYVAGIQYGIVERRTR